MKMRIFTILFLSLLLILSHPTSARLQSMMFGENKDINIQPVNEATQAAQAANDKAKANARVVEEEQETPLHNFSEQELNKIKSSEENFSFQADVQRVMEILTHSLYSHRKIFIRELISNAVDALDKVRYLQLTKGKEVGILEIKVRADEKANTLTITDTGIGMNKSDLSENLGTVARSGTSKFLEAFDKLSKSDDTETKREKSKLQLIGQFGVGFYSAFLVADEVVVVSKLDSDKQYVWKSRSDGAFTVSEDPRGNTMVRGTSIILKLKNDAKEFLDEHTLRQTITRYSEFLTYPIYLYAKHVEFEEVPKEKKPTDDTDANAENGDLKEKKEEKETEDDVKVEDDKEEEEEESKTEKIQKIFWKQDHLNLHPPIQTRSRDSITDQDYKDFYKVVAKDESASEPLSQIHFKAEGENSFSSILYIPEKPPYNFYDNYYSNKNEIRLYVQRVLINDNIGNILPKYLSFVKGILDSDDLPLNVNREQLQKSRLMNKISKKLTKKILNMIKKMADTSELAQKKNLSDKKDKQNDEDATEEETKETSTTDNNRNESSKADDTEKTKYFEFYKHYSKSVKLGLVEDEANKEIMKKLLRYYSSVEDKYPISFDQYISRMPEKQKGIFYISGESIDALKNSPHLEKIKKAGLEQLYLVDPLDEYIVDHLKEYEDVPLISLSSEGFELKESKKSEKMFFEKLNNEFKPLIDFLKDLFIDKVSKVAISKRLDTSPCILVNSYFGMSANMERIQRFQALSTDKSQLAKKVLEINYRHPIILEIKSRVEAKGKENALKDEELRNYAEILYDSALLSGGYTHENPVKFVERVNSLVWKGLGVSKDAKVEPEEEFAADDEESDKESETDNVDLDTEANTDNVDGVSNEDFSESESKTDEGKEDDNVHSDL